MAVTGLDLKLRRTAARVKLIELAARMGRSRATVSRYEQLAVVPADRAQEYLEALATFGDLATLAPASGSQAVEAA